MRRFLPKSFRFSPLVTGAAVCLALVMLRCSAWQWERYLEKTALVEAYEGNSLSPPLSLPSSLAPSDSSLSNANSHPQYTDVLHRKVRVAGKYDYSRQVLIVNQKHATGPGYWLMTPMQIEGSNEYLLVSRGFIPFHDYTEEAWQKYQFSEREEIQAVVQASVPHRSFLHPRNPQITTESPWQTKWLYPDLVTMAPQFPYPINTQIFLQRLGGPAVGTFPSEAVSIQVPPSTHFGYTIEWIILAFATLVIAFIFQSRPRKPSPNVSASKNTESGSQHSLVANE